MAWKSRSREDIDEHRDARRALDENGRRERARGSTDETEEYRSANQRVADTEKNVSWWRR